MSDLLNKASLVMIPSGYKEDIVYSVIPTSGAGDLTFTRASNGTRINSAGLVEVCPWNLCTYSEQFQNADWLGGGNGKPTMTDNFAEAPNGTMTASKMVAASDGYQLRQNNAQENTQMNLSVWLRTNTGTKTIQLFLNNANTASQNITVTTTWTRYEISGLVTTLAGSGRNGLNTLEALTSSNYILVWGFQLSVGLTAKPYFPTTDRLNVPRLTYQNGGGGCPSLLLEKQSTNYAQYSEDFSNGFWTKDTMTTVTANDGISPDGTQNADRFESPSSIKGIYSYGVSGSETISVYIKAGNSANVGKSAVLFTTTATQDFILTNDWQRISVSGSASSLWALYPSATNSFTNVLIWGAQAESGSYPTSYIPTTTSSATRVADACFKTGISSLIGQTEGTMFVDFNFENTLDVNGSIVMIIYGTGGEAFIYINGGSLLLQVYNSGVVQGNISISIGAVGRKKIAFAYKQNDFVGYMNGTQIGTDTSGTIPAMSTLRLGEYYATGYSLNSGINEAILFPTRLTNAELASITSL